MMMTILRANKAESSRVYETIPVINWMQNIIVP